MKTCLCLSELDLLQAISVPFEDPKHVYFAEGLHGLHAFGLRAGELPHHQLYLGVNGCFDGKYYRASEVVLALLNSK